MTETTPKATLDARAFRAALGAFVTGVTIITTADADGAPVGLTANSFNSVSLDPPLVLFSLGLDSTSLDAFRQAEWWAVHVLSTDQEALSNQFARREGNKFLNVAFGNGPGGIPLLDGAAARFVCRAAFEYEGGDHAIFLGEVREFEQAGRPPLIYHAGRYGGVFPAGSAIAEDATGVEGLARLGLLTMEGDKATLTPEGQMVTRNLAGLAHLDDRFSAHERSALKHLLSRLAS